ncbi:MAG: hypothetical protein K0V04_17640, partial [Deltaproteobacteria bacterium]|nr:hypothetical protein [Deltaproteobacteria bacterium]
FRSPDLDTAREMVSEWGNDASSFAVVLVDGHEVYRKTPDSPPRRRNGWSWRRQHGPQSPEITRG